LLPLPNISQYKDQSRQDKAEYVKKLHEKVKAQIEKKMEGCTKNVNKGRKKRLHLNQVTGICAFQKE